MNARAWWVFLFTATFVWAPALASAEDMAVTVALKDESECCVDQSDQIILASTRNYPSCPGRTLDFDKFNGFVYTPSGCFTGAEVSLLENDDHAETWIFVHGNQIPPDVAVQRGTKVYRRLRPYAAPEKPIRFIIWSWPSERDGGRLADARRKRKRTEAEAFYLGSFLSASAPTGTANILGYSFGARVVSGALHLCGGGNLCGYKLPDIHRPAEPYRVAFLAAAVESDGFNRGCLYGQALSNVDHLLLQNNSSDMALRYFWVTNRTKPKALGHTGLAYAPAHCSVQQFDWEDYIGKDHSLWCYLDRAVILRRIASNFER